jgi:hypothetical protein
MGGGGSDPEFVVLRANSCRGFPQNPMNRAKSSLIVLIPTPPSGCFVRVIRIFRG